MDDRSYTYSTQSVEDYLPFTDLSVERALDILPVDVRDNYAAAYAWFMAKSDTSGSRHLGGTIPGVTQDFKIAAQRGIHVPSRQDFAVSVTSSPTSRYAKSDRPLIELPNGTWVFEYAAHRNNSGGVTDMRYNEGLLRCLRCGVPVGVFIGLGGGTYLRYLAFVEAYDERRDVFTLHGPITAMSDERFSSDIPTDVDVDRVRLATKSAQDEYRLAARMRAYKVRQIAYKSKLLDAYGGRCAITGCDTASVLEPTHIIDYRGVRGYHVAHGLLLRSDVRLLFERSLIAINPKTHRLDIGRPLYGTPYEEYGDREVWVPDTEGLSPSLAYLTAAYERFKRLEALEAV